LDKKWNFDLEHCPIDELTPITIWTCSNGKIGSGNRIGATKSYLIIETVRSYTRVIKIAYPGYAKIFFKKKEMFNKLYQILEIIEILRFSRNFILFFNFLNVFTNLRKNSYVEIFKKFWIFRFFFVFFFTIFRDTQIYNTELDNTSQIWT